MIASKRAEGPEADTSRLRRAIRDLVALSTVPAAWVGREPAAIVAGLADVLVNFGRKVGAITRRRNQTALGSDADGDDNAAAALRATSNVANDFPARQVAVDGEMMLQPFRKCLPCGSPRDFDRGTPVGITQTHKSEVEVQ